MTSLNVNAKLGPLYPKHALYRLGYNVGREYVYERLAAAIYGRGELARYVCLTQDWGTLAGANRFQTA